LQVVEIERGLAILGLLVRALEFLEQLLKQIAVPRRNRVQRCLFDRFASLLVVVVLLDRVVGQLEQRLSRGLAVEELEQPGSPVSPALRSEGAQVPGLLLESRSIAEGEHERPTRRA